MPIHRQKINIFGMSLFLIKELLLLGDDFIKKLQITKQTSLKKNG